MTLFRFQSGSLAYVNGNQVALQPQNDVDVYGSSGRIRATNLSRHFQDGELQVTTQEGEQTTAEATGDVFQRLIADFCQAVTEAREPLATGVDGLRCVELTEAIARSARERATVQVERVDIGV
jgi:predicted dehydrogenase